MAPRERLTRRVAVGELAVKRQNGKRRNRAPVDTDGARFCVTDEASRGPASCRVSATSRWLEHVSRCARDHDTQ
jgi:hypothetical protein